MDSNCKKKQEIRRNRNLSSKHSTQGRSDSKSGKSQGCKRSPTNSVEIGLLPWPVHQLPDFPVWTSE